MIKRIKQFTFIELAMAAVFAVQLTLPPQDVLDWYMKFIMMYLVLYNLAIVVKND